MEFNTLCRRMSCYETRISKCKEAGLLFLITGQVKT